MVVEWAVQAVARACPDLMCYKVRAAAGVSEGGGGKRERQRERERQSWREREGERETETETEKESEGGKNEEKSVDGERGDNSNVMMTLSMRYLRC